MSKIKAKRNSAYNHARSGRSSYAVGYGSPPRAHQFKPGTSGNPKGRPKGAKNESTILNAILNRQIESREAGRIRKISVLEGMLLKFAEDALKGNTKSATFLLNRYRLAEATTPEETDLDQDDREVLEACMRDLEIRLKGKKR
jgi:hypothetical protein